METSFSSFSFFFDDTHYNLVGRWFRQITPLGIWHTRSLGTNGIPQAPRLSHTPGAPDPKSKVAPQLFPRAAEAVLGISFNTQSQVPNIPGIPLRASISRYLVSLQAQSKAPDIPMLSLRTSSEELLVSV